MSAEHAIPDGLFGPIVERCVQGIMVLGDEGQVLYLNPAAESLLGRTRDEIYGGSLGVPSGSRGSTEICLTDGQNHVRFVELSFQPLPEAGEHATLATLANVTQYRRERAEAVEEADRLDRFLAVLSHELRNPFGALIGAFELMKDRDRDDPVRQKSVEVAKRQIALLRRLLDDLLDMSRVTRDRLTLETAPLPVAEVIRNAEEMVRDLAELSDHHMMVAAVDPLMWVDGDNARLTQSVTNLLTNAVRYTPAGSVIQVSADCDESTVQIRVTDNGPGIAAEVVSDIFKPFVRGNDSRSVDDPGMGIGLALVRKIAGLHDGSISVRNLTDVSGCEFTLTLPRLKPTQEMLRKVEQSDDATSLAEVPGNTRVLIAEDNADLRRLMTILLENAGLEVVPVGDGRSACEMIGGGHADVAILDIGLPQMDGLTAARYVRRELGMKEMPLIALTGYGRPEDRDEALRSGFDAHLTKPPDIDDLRRLIAELASRN